MRILFMILYGVVFVAVFVGVVFLQKFLTKKRILLGLIFPVIYLCNSIMIDIQMISQIYDFYSGPKTIVQYKNGLLISKSTIVSNWISLPSIILILIAANIFTIILFIIFFVDRKKIKCKKELAKMRITDLE